MSLAEGVFLHSWLTEWRHFFKGAGGIILKQQFPFLWVNEQRKKVFWKGFSNVQEDWRCYRSKEPSWNNWAWRVMVLLMMIQQ